ncbi:MAG: methyltransferase [Clostridia bacterium]|nr:methyltransferase [Clostridia bacterium]
MKKIKSDCLDSLCELFVRAFEAKTLKKAVFSKPESVDEIKTTVSPKKIGTSYVLQAETFSKDNKVYHRNIKSDFAKECQELFYSHAQINIFTSVGDCQYMISKSGKETVIGDKNIKKALDNGSFDTVSEEENNKQKNYLLSGDEDFLKKLGISDETGRVRDKKQSKYRQINKFLEHVESVIDKLPENEINVYDLCCGKSYLSFAVYHYFKNIRSINIEMICIDLKQDVIEYCDNLAKRLGFNGMKFICGDIKNYNMEKKPDLVISLHACDIATDIVLDKASDNGASVILSTPCCHHELNHKINCKELNFITRHSMLRQKLCDAATDAMRILKLEAAGYEASALELIDPEDTPKNIIIRAIKKQRMDEKRAEVLKKEYAEVRKFLLGEEDI